MEPLHYFTSPTLAAKIVACGHCGVLHTERTGRFVTDPQGRTTGKQVDAETAARECCRCQWPDGCDSASLHGWQFCAEHKSVAHVRQREIDREKAMRLPVDAEYSGPVYVDDIDKWFACPAEAIEWLEDDPDKEWNPTDVLAYPATVYRPDGPDVRGWLADDWSTDDGDDVWLSPAIVAAIEALHAACVEHAPERWVAITTRRVSLADAALVA